MKAVSPRNRMKQAARATDCSPTGDVPEYTAVWPSGLEHDSAAALTALLSDKRITGKKSTGEE